MTDEQKAQIVEILSIRAQIAGSNFTPPALIQMANDLEDLEFNRVVKELSAWGKTQTGFPFPAKIREKINPELSADDTATITANLIVKAVSRYGYTNREAAKNFMGSLAWSVVDRFGGWQNICETMNSDNIGMMRAQLRGLAAVTGKEVLREEHAVAIADQSRDIKQLVNGAMKVLE